MIHTYTELDVRAALFHTGLSLQAQEKGITPRELLNLKSRALYIKNEPRQEYWENVALLERGEELTAEAALLMSPRAFSPSPALEEWKMIVEKMVCSPFVEVAVSSEDLNRVAGMLGLGPTVYLAALVKK